LLARLTETAGEAVTKQRDWPRSPRALGGQLRRLAPNLRRAGVTLDQWREAGGKRSRMVRVAHENGAATDGPDRPDGPEPLETNGPGGTVRDRSPDRRDGSQPQKAHDRTIRDDWDRSAHTCSSRVPVNGNGSADAWFAEGHEGETTPFVDGVAAN
jgi:hypothetical protein